MLNILIFNLKKKKKKKKKKLFKNGKFEKFGKSVTILLNFNLLKPMPLREKSIISFR